MRSGATVDLESDEWLVLRIDRPPGEGECSWLDAGETGAPPGKSFLLVSSVLGELLPEVPVAAELGVRTTPLDSVSIEEIEVPRSRLMTCGGAVCGMRVTEGRPSWLD